ncbi:glycoside hydrolase family 113 [Paenibacillus sp. UASWS1643]|uniref:glycoside hydrolase family 113 n=1 Tax=Paenibacillus sp. UASWS1643 TaxID=2580422 RepID=UPI00123C36AE|nr:1,4-beta-xylanase [Paenibacillus sp. UASWS1643]KAA8753352.1 1,4-beta-xylanase [Paenibacillus sp. UASWS1643]
MEYIKGFTFGWMSGRGDFRKPEARESLRLMAERTGSSHVIFALAAQQDHPQAVEVKYRGEHLVEDDELVDMIRYARTLGLRVILKPTVNCTDGTWRAHINFFDIDVPCEPKWKDWFRSYTAFQKHYAAIAEQEKCEMFIVGCEMVQSERRDQEWREVIAGVRDVYTGLVSYNTDKYQEGHVKWWDAVDVISSSGYYPIGDWEAQLDRIEQVIAPYGKPFFFAEAGCPSRSGSAQVPNDWGLEGEVSAEEQERFYEAMFRHVSQRDWVRGFGLWDWSAHLHAERDALIDDGYGVYGKPAENIIRRFYEGITAEV